MSREEVVGATHWIFIEVLVLEVSSTVGTAKPVGTEEAY